MSGTDNDRSVVALCRLETELFIQQRRKSRARTRLQPGPLQSWCRSCMHVCMYGCACTYTIHSNNSINNHRSLDRIPGFWRMCGKKKYHSHSFSSSSLVASLADIDASIGNKRQGTQMWFKVIWSWASTGKSVFLAGMNHHPTSSPAHISSSLIVNN